MVENIAFFMAPTKYFLEYALFNLLGSAPKYLSSRNSNLGVPSHSFPSKYSFSGLYCLSSATWPTLSNTNWVDGVILYTASIHVAILPNWLSSKAFPFQYTVLSKVLNRSWEKYGCFINRRTTLYLDDFTV